MSASASNANQVFDPLAFFLCRHFANSLGSPRASNSSITSTPRSIPSDVRLLRPNLSDGGYSANGTSFVFLMRGHIGVICQTRRRVTYYQMWVLVTGNNSTKHSQTLRKTLHHPFPKNCTWGLLSLFRPIIRLSVPAAMIIHASSHSSLSTLSVNLMAAFSSAINLLESHRNNHS